MKTSTAHFIDRVAGIPLCQVFSYAKRAAAFLRGFPTTSEPRKILILKFWGMGSILLMIPGLKELKKAYPQASITLVTLSQNDALAEMIPEIDRFECLDFQKGAASFFGQTVRLLHRLRVERFDLLYDLEFFTSFSALFSLFSGALKTVGFYERHSARGQLHDVLIPFNQYWHVSDIFHHALLQQGKLKGSPPVPWVKIPESAIQKCRKILQEADWEGLSSSPVVMINPNAGPLAPERRWPPAHFRSLLTKILSESNCRIILIGTHEEYSYVESLREESAEEKGGPARVLNLAGKLGIQELAAMMQVGAVVVSNDSGPLHLAVALGIPTVSLFGPETPVLYGPRGPSDVVLFRDLPCSPCINVYKNKILWCRHGQNFCLEQIPVDEVFAAVSRVLHGVSGRS